MTGLEFFIYSVVMLAVSYALAPKPPSPSPPAVQQLSDVPVAERGKPIPVVFGTVSVKGANIIWYGQMSTSKIQTKSGGK